MVCDKDTVLQENMQVLFHFIERKQNLHQKHPATARNCLGKGGDGVISWRHARPAP